MSEPSSQSAQEQVPVIAGRPSYASVADRITAIPQGEVGRIWLAGICLGMFGVMVLGVATAWLILRGVGIWGINIPVAWGFAIVNFVWWIGFGHAGTLISAILLLLRQEWRTSINRLAEAMTLFAVAMAGMFPLLHLGRIWKFFYLFPYPNRMDLWPQWRSALVLDVAAISTYFLVSLIFWYVGLVPDLATLRDTARRKRTRIIAGIFALGWRGSARHWHRYRMLYLLIAGLATPLVVSVHSIVSVDFAMAIVPGWHSTVFPPYFVAGALFQGFAMVLTIIIPFRAAFGMKDLITEQHVNNLAKLMLVAGLVTNYGYAVEYFIAWFSADRFEYYIAINRALGDYWPVWWITVISNFVAIQPLWFRAVRYSPVTLFIIAQFVNVGMWTERYAIVIVSLHRDYMPSMWGEYHGTIWDWLLLLGSIGTFIFLMFLLVRLVPVVSIHELGELMHRKGLKPETPPKSAELTETSTQRLPDEKLYGLMAEFDRPEPLLEAARRARAAGFREFDAYSPHPVDDIDEAMGLRRSGIAPTMLLGGVVGAGLTYWMCWYSATIAYPFNIGGRPYHSWQSFIPLTFELGVLGATLFGFAGMLALNRLPRLHHPIFNAPGFERASRDRFFLCIQRSDPQFERSGTHHWLAELEPMRISEVEQDGTLP